MSIPLSFANGLRFWVVGYLHWQNASKKKKKMLSLFKDSGNYDDPWAKSSLLPVFINKVLLKHGNIHLFTYGCFQPKRAKTLAYKPKVFTAWFFTHRKVMLTLGLTSLPTLIQTSILIKPGWSACDTAKNRIWERKLKVPSNKGNCSMEQIKVKPKSFKMNWRYQSSGIQQY